MRLLFILVFTSSVFSADFNLKKGSVIVYDRVTETMTAEIGLSYGIDYFLGDCGSTYCEYTPSTKSFDLLWGVKGVTGCIGSNDGSFDDFNGSVEPGDGITEGEFTKTINGTFPTGIITFTLTCNWGQFKSFEIVKDLGSFDRSISLPENKKYVLFNYGISLLIIEYELNKDSLPLRKPIISLIGDNIYKTNIVLSSLSDFKNFKLNVDDDLNYQIYFSPIGSNKPVGLCDMFSHTPYVFISTYSEKQSNLQRECVLNPRQTYNFKSHFLNVSN